MGVRIELAALEDRDSVVALWQAAGLTRPWNDPDTDYDLALTNPTSVIFLARTHTALVGSVMVGFDGHRGWVYYLASDPEQRARGIGRALMTAAEGWLRPKIQLMVRGDNAAARGFYAAIGYADQDVITIGRRRDKEP